VAQARRIGSATRQGGVPRLMLILDHAVAGGDAAFLDRLEQVWPMLPRDGSVWLQLRAKRLSREARVALLAAARGVARGEGAPILVNGTSGDALTAGFVGVHWPEALRPTEPPPALARLRSISAAVHDLDGARAAARAGARVVTWSPVFAPRSKPGEGRGLDALAAVCRQSPLPVLALGGITAERVGACLEAGAAGVAVLSAISAPGANVEAEVRRLVEAVG